MPLILPVSSPYSSSLDTAHVTSNRPWRRPGPLDIHASKAYSSVSNHDLTAMKGTVPDPAHVPSDPGAVKARKHGGQGRSPLSCFPDARRRRGNRVSPLQRQRGPAAPPGVTGLPGWYRGMIRPWRGGFLHSEHRTQHTEKR